MEERIKQTLQTAKNYLIRADTLLKPCFDTLWLAKHEFSSTLLMRSIHRLFWLFLLSVPSGHGIATDNQSLHEIQEIARNFVLEQAGTPEQEGNIEVTPGPLDRRLRLPKCSHPLQAFFPSGSRPTGNTTVGVRCTSETPWTVYLSVKVSVYGKVLVATRPRGQHTPLTSADVRLERRDLGLLRQGYLVDPTQVVGKRLKRPLRLGAVLTPNILKVPKLIRRGQQVTLSAEVPGLQVRMSGKALEDAGAGEYARVRNISSRRIVEGIVTAEGLVHVQM